MVRILSASLPVVKRRQSFVIRARHRSWRRREPAQCTWCSASDHLNRPGRGAVAVLDLEREANQIVLAGLHRQQAQALDYPDSGPEERPVRLDAVLAEPAHREVVDADGADPAGREFARRLL